MASHLPNVWKQKLEKKKHMLVCIHRWSMIVIDSFEQKMTWNMYKPCINLWGCLEKKQIQCFKILVKHATIVQVNPFKNHPTIVSHLHLFGWTWKTMSVYLHSDIVAKLWRHNQELIYIWICRHLSPIEEEIPHLTGLGYPLHLEQLSPWIGKIGSHPGILGTIFNPKTVCESFTHPIRLI